MTMVHFKTWGYIIRTPLTLTHWVRVTHICVVNLTIIGSNNGVLLARCRAIIWTNAWILLIGPLGTNFCEILIEIHTFSFQQIAFENIVTKMAASTVCLKMQGNCSINQKAGRDRNSMWPKVNSSPPSTAYMRSALFQIMVCHLFGAKPLSKSMLGHCQLDP